MGLVGLALARLGARVTLTDKPPLLPLLRRNIAANWLGTPCVRCVIQARRTGFMGDTDVATALLGVSWFILLRQRFSWASRLRLATSAVLTC